MWNATPVIAIDMADHAYYYDYGSRRTEYLNAIIRNLNWQNVVVNLQSALDAMMAAGLAVAVEKFGPVSDPSDAPATAELTSAHAAGV